MKIPTRQRRKILNALHKDLEGRKRCPTFKQMALFVNENIPGWRALVVTTSYTPARKLGKGVSWFGQRRTGHKLRIHAVKPGGGDLLVEHDSTDSHHRNSFTLREILFQMGCGSGSTKSADDELERYEWYNPFGFPVSTRARRRS
jgi:hypothetical protein